MGTKSLIFGIMAIGIAIGFTVDAFLFLSVFPMLYGGFLISLGIAIIAGGIGAVFLKGKSSIL